MLSTSASVCSKTIPRTSLRTIPSRSIHSCLLQASPTLKSTTSRSFCHSPLNNSINHSTSSSKSEGSVFSLKTSRSGSKLYPNAEKAVEDVKSGSVVLSAGFGLCGTAETILDAFRKRKDLTDLKAVTNNAGASVTGGLGPLVGSGQVTSVILSYLGNNKQLEQKYIDGEISLELCPQGTLAERIRAGGAGIPAFYTATGGSTALQDGAIPIKLGAQNADGSQEVAVKGHPRETREFDGKPYLLERAIKGHVGILRAAKVDEDGNCVFRRTTKAFGPLMAKAASLTIVEADSIVKTGEIDPDDVHLPGIYVDRIVPAVKPKLIEFRKVRNGDENGDQTKKDGAEEMSPAAVRRQRIAKRASRELKDGFYVNLGVGMPTLAPTFLDPTVKVRVQSENGLLGMGPHPKEDEVDPDLVNAGKETVTFVPGASTFDSAESFAMIRGGHIDVSLLGAMEVSASGDLANYMIPRKVVKGMGGAMDLVSNPESTNIVVLTDHVDKRGNPKILEKCHLPLTGARVASRIITDLCVFDVDRVRGGLTLVELAPGVDLETVKSKTGCSFKVAEDVQTMYC